MRERPERRCFYPGELVRCWGGSLCVCAWFHLSLSAPAGELSEGRKCGLTCEVTSRHTNKEQLSFLSFNIQILDKHQIRGGGAARRAATSITTGQRHSPLQTGSLRAAAVLQKEERQVSFHLFVYKITWTRLYCWF